MSKQQTEPTTPWWENKKIIIRIVVSALLVVIVFIVFIASAYTFHWSGTGFTSFHKTTTTIEVTQLSNAKKVTTTTEDQPAKTLWDWLPLLIQLLGALAIPVVVGFGTAFFTRQQAKTSEANAESQQQEELLRTYFDKISDLLLDKEQSTNPNIQSIVRARTLAALHILNTERKAVVLRFLSETALLQLVKSFLYSLDLSHTDLNRIDLSGANLRETNLNGANLLEANLSGADLAGANLSGAKLWKANLSGANLRETNLNGADLLGAKLSGASLSGALLSHAKLWGANLSGAYLGGANLSGANLDEAELDEAELDEANLSGAKLWKANLSGAYLGGANLSGANLSETNLSETILTDADLRGANLSKASITPEQLEEARNVTSGQLAQIYSPKTAAIQKAKAAQISITPVSSEIKPTHTSQEEAGQQELKQPNQGTDTAH